MTDSIFNSNDVDKFAVARVLLVFYVLLANNYTDNLFSKQMRAYLDENRYAQHLVGFILMLILIMLLGNIKKIENGILISIFLYIWFLLTTKLDIQFSMMIILVLLFAYIYESKLREREEEVKTDVILGMERKESLLRTYNNYKLYMLLCVIVITVTGTILYMDKKDVQYGGSYSFMSYLFY